MPQQFFFSLVAVGFGRKERASVSGGVGKAASVSLLLAEGLPGSPLMHWSPFFFSLLDLEEMKPT